MNKTEIKLKVVAEEIKELLKKHDVAAAVALHLPGHGEHFVHLNPSYSCAYVYNDNEVRFYAKVADYPSIEEHQKKVTETSNMMHILTTGTGINFMGLEECSRTLDKATGAKYF